MNFPHPLRKRIHIAQWNLPGIISYDEVCLEEVFTANLLDLIVVCFGQLLVGLVEARLGF